MANASSADAASVAQRFQRGEEGSLSVLLGSFATRLERQLERAYGRSLIHPVAAVFTPLALVRVTLGSALLVAAGLKWYSLAASAAIREPGGPWLALGVVTAEVCLGAWLLAGFRASLSARAATGWFALLAGVSLVKVASGEDTCGCLGDAIEIPPWAALAFDLAALALLSRFAPHPTDDQPGGWRPSVKPLCACALVISVAPAAAYAIASHNVAVLGETSIDQQGQKRIALALDRWEGQRCPLLPYIDVSQDLAQGDWLLVLYRANCEKCRRALRRYQELAARLPSAGDRPQVVLVELAGDEATVPN